MPLILNEFLIQGIREKCRTATNAQFGSTFSCLATVCKSHFMILP